MRLIFSVLFPLLGSFACSSDAPSTTPITADGGPTEGGSDSGSDGGAPRTPVKHRASPTACPTTRDPGHPESSFSGCKSDDECNDASAGKNGRCIATLGAGNTCSYDQCAADVDCGSASVCDCRNSVQRGANACFKGNCRTDDDCKGDFCSPSAVTIDPGCLGVPFGAVGFFCHGESDACRDDADCSGPDPRCIFDPDLLHWRCASLSCPG